MLNMKKCKKINKINKISKIKYLFNKNNEYFSDFNKRNGIEYIYLDIKNNKNVEEFLRNIKIKYAKEEYYSTNYIVDKKGRIYCMLKENIISYHTNNNIENLKTKHPEILNNIDVLIDGEYVEEQKDFSRPWVGSANQGYHFLTDRYDEKILTEYKNQVEINIQKNGLVFINGMGDFEKLTKKLEMASFH